jgi:putative transport protein
MTSLGLAAFVGLTGIHAGPIFLSALRESGIGLLLGGMLVTLLPQIIGFCVGHFVLRMNPILLLGALTGAQTVTAAMAAIQERSESSVVVLGYTPAYPVANILLTTWGSVMVAVFAG